MTWRDELETELENGARARSRGKEGQARVCARRAAGIAIRQYLTRRGIRPRSHSAVDLLEQIRQDRQTPADLLPLIDHLALRVDEDFKLPPGIDLLAEARRLSNSLIDL